MKNISRKDFFAGMALCGFMASCPWPEPDTNGDPTLTNMDKKTLKLLANMCNEVAEAFGND